MISLYPIPTILEETKQNESSFFQVLRERLGLEVVAFSSARQLFHAPSDKELSIAQFKERYGGYLFPKVYWVGYFNKQSMKNDLIKEFNDFIDNYDGFSFPRVF